VLASGTLDSVDTLPYGHADWYYRLDRPTPIGRYAVAVGPYLTALRSTPGCQGCPAVEAWSYRGDSAVAAAAFRRAGEIAAYFAGLLGRFPYERLVHVEAAIAEDAVSSAEMALYREDAYGSAGPAEGLIARETARQWLGVAVSPDSAPARRLFEGMPRYLAAMWRASAGGPSLAQAMAAGVDSALTAGPAQDAWRGAWTLHELRGVIGDSAFTAGLRALVEQRRDSTATLDEVALAMSRVAGTDAGWVLRQAEGEVPVVRWRAERRGGGYRLRLTAPQADSLRLPGLRLLVDGRRVRADLEKSEASVALPRLRRPPAKVELDPAGTWLVRLQRAE
jgi:hypothetical protein